MAYHVRWSGATWVLASPDDTILFRSFERSPSVATAKEMARQIDGQVFVYDRNGSLEVVYSYSVGVESIERHVMPPFRSIDRNRISSPAARAYEGSEGTYIVI
jgi:hypothetical protein